MARLEFDVRPVDSKMNRLAPFGAVRVYPETNDEITNILWFINCFKPTARILLNTLPAHMAIIFDITDEYQEKKDKWIKTGEVD